MKKVLRVFILLLIVLIVGFVFYALAGERMHVKNAVDYYDNLAKQCSLEGGKGCCLASVKIMKENNYELSKDGNCEIGFVPNTMKCVGSFKWCVRQSIEEIKSVVQRDQASTTSVENIDFDSEIKDWKTFKSSGTFNFRYPEQDCYLDRCYNIGFNEVDGVISFPMKDGDGFPIYYGKNIINENAANNFLQNILSSPLCKIDSIEERGEGIKFLRLNEACYAYGPLYEGYIEDNPGIKLLSGKVGAYWNMKSKELIVYQLGPGGGCQFYACDTDAKISRTMRFGEEYIKK